MYSNTTQHTLRKALRIENKGLRTTNLEEEPVSRSGRTINQVAQMEPERVIALREDRQTVTGADEDASGSPDASSY